MCATCPAHLILLDLLKEYLVKSINNGTPSYAIFSILPLLIF